MNGKESNSGFYADAAKKYINSAFDLTERGDVVIALPGDYAEDPPRLHSSTATVKTRVVVPEYRTLVARDGAAVTAIVGAASPNPVRDYDLGPDAVRCAFLNYGSKIVGFTLRDGRTSAPATGTDDSIDYRGGGALASEPQGRELVDCIVTNCASLRGGGAYSVTLRRCRIVGNKAIHFGSAGNSCHLYRSYVNHNRGGQTFWLYQGRVEGCTVGSDNGGSGLRFDGKTADYHVFNSIFAGGSVDAQGGTNIYDCAFAPGTYVYGTNALANCVFGEVALEGDGTPVIGHNVGIDRGNPDRMTATDRACDLNGTTRIWNADIDAGAIEVDWRAHYSKSLRRRFLTVTDAPESAKEQANGQIRLVDGALAATWDPVPGNPSRRELRYSVPGTGTLTVTVDGTVVDTASAGETKTYQFTSGDGANALSFAYVPGADDALGALIGPFRDRRGLVLFFK